MSIQERMQSQRNYGIQARAARIFYGQDEWSDALDADVKLPAAAVAAITQLNLPNGPQIAHYLGRHRQVCDELVQMRKHPRRIEERILELSHKLASGDLELDQLPYRQYAGIRERKVRGRR